MKKLLVVLLVAFALNGFAQQKPLEWNTDVNKAVNLSIQTGKPLFFFFTGSDWCGWCKRLQREVFFKPEFAVWANKNVVLVELDFPRRTKLSAELQKQNRELQQMFGVRGYPSIWFTSGKIIKNTLIKKQQLINDFNSNKEDVQKQEEIKKLIHILYRDTQKSSFGSQGYVAGGPNTWIAGANKIIKLKK